MTEGNRELVTKDDMAESYSNEVEINENTLANIANENIRKRLLDRMDPNFGLLDKLLANKAIDRNELQIVKSRDTTYERNVRLFDIITEKRKYRELFEALRDSNQNHLVNYVTANGVYSKRYYKVWPLTSREMNILDCNQEFLVDTIDVSNNELIGKLYAIGFLNKRQREHLCELQHSYKKTETLLDMLQRSSLNGYSQMIVCLLEMNQSHVAQLLDEGGVAVPIHNTIDGEGEAQRRDEEELVTQMQNLLQDRPVGKVHRILETLQLRLIAGKRGQSIVLYILCKSLNDLSLLFDLLKTGELRKRIQRFFSDLVQRSDRIVATTILPKNDFEKYKKYFAGELEEEYVMPNPARSKWLTPIYTVLPNDFGSLFLSLTALSPLLLLILGLESITSSFQLLMITLSSLFVLFNRLYRDRSELSDDVVSLFVYFASIPLLLLCCGLDSIASQLFPPLCTLSLILLLHNCFFKISSFPSHISMWKMRLAVSGTLLVAIVVTGVIGRWLLPELLSLLKLYPTATRLVAGFICECLCVFLDIKRTRLLGLVQWLLFVMTAEVIRVYDLFVSYNLYRLTLALWAWNYLLSQIGFLQSAKTQKDLPIHKINASRRSLIQKSSTSLRSKTMSAS